MVFTQRVSTNDDYVTSLTTDSCCQTDMTSVSVVQCNETVYPSKTEYYHNKGCLGFRAVASLVCTDAAGEWCWLQAVVTYSIFCPFSQRSKSLIFHWPDTHSSCKEYQWIIFSKVMAVLFHSLGNRNHRARRERTLWIINHFNPNIEDGLQQFHGEKNILFPRTVTVL